MTERLINLVLPLDHKSTAMHTTDTSDSNHVRSGAVSGLIGESLRAGDVDSKKLTCSALATLGFRTSTMAIRITGTSTTTTGLGQFANQYERRHAEVSFEDLVKAYFDCRKNKRNTKSALEFEQNLEANLCDLYDELITGSYKPGKSICFVITHPKPREVWAADFRDRVVHHLMYNHISPNFYSSFIADSCACIPGRGTLYGANRLELKVRSITQNWRKPAHYLKLDIQNFFVSINKDILAALLSQKIPQGYWLELTKQILFHDPRVNFEFQGHPSSIELVPRYKRLTSHPAHLGLPIGNLSSQFFANIYMNELDQFVKHQIGARHYIRYVDDMVLLHESAQWLNNAKDRIEQFLAERLNANINPKKTILQPIDRGIDFVGQVIKPWRRSARRRNVSQAVKAIQSAPVKDLLSTSNSYFGLLCQAKSHHDRSVLANAVMARGRSVNRQFTKSYRGSQK